MYDYLAIAYVFLFVVNPVICTAYFFAFIWSNFNSKSGFWKRWAYPFISIAAGFAGMLALLIAPFIYDFNFAKFEASVPFGSKWHFIIMMLFICFAGFLGAIWFADWEEYRLQKRCSAYTKPEDKPAEPQPDAPTSVHALETFLFKAGFLKDYCYVIFPDHIAVDIKFGSYCEPHKTYTRRLFIWHGNGRFCYKIYNDCTCDIENGQHIKPTEMDCSPSDFADHLMSLDFRGLA